MPPGCLVGARLIGVLEVEQKARGKRWQTNDRFIAVATESQSHAGLTRLADLRPHLLEEIEAFFVHYTGMDGKKLRLLRRSGPKRARRRLASGEAAFRKRR